MQNTYNFHLGTLLSLCSILVLMITIPVNPTREDINKSLRLFPSFTLGGHGALAFEAASPDQLHTVRVARRLARRVAEMQGTSPPISVLIRALEEQRTVLNNQTMVTLRFPVTQVERPWAVSLQRYPTWMKAEFTPGTAHFRIDEGRIREYLTRETIEGIIPPHQTIITAIKQDGKVQRVVTSSGAARSGIAFDMPMTSAALADALSQGIKNIIVPLSIVPGRIINATNTPLGDLTLLGTGKSDYKGSPGARITNIKTALNKHVNNVLVAPGATFSFNDTLGGPVSESNGWKLAKVIFNAKDLVMAPGGGICQASTTVFRAMLQAGFTPIKRANHSMYVSYYEMYGVGIDATVFPGKQDLTFVNDSGSPLLLQAYEEGSEATVHIYGTPDGRQSTVQGPYFWSSDFSDYPAEKDTPHRNEISWIHRVTFADGRTEENMVVSRYTSLPASIAKKYDLLHASAESPLLKASVSQR